MPEKHAKTTENPLLGKALEALRAGAGIGHARVETGERYAGAGKQVDGYVWLDEPLGRHVFEVKKYLTPAQVGAVAARVRELLLADPVLLVTDYVTPQVAKALRGREIQFIDAVGNAFLQRRDPPVYVWVTGNKPETPAAHKPVTTFRAKGLRVIFPLLCMPDAVQEPYRQIAEWAGVSLGTVANTLEDLERLGYVRKARKGRVLENRNDLMRRWVEAYPQVLRPRLKPQRFHVPHPDWWKKFVYTDFERYDLWMGGEVAAAILTRYLYPEVTTVYGRPDFRKFAKKVVQPLRDERGNFELLEPFWNFEMPHLDETCRICPPLLVYADLVRTGEARHLDAAELIRKKYLENA